MSGIVCRCVDTRLDGWQSIFDGCAEPALLGRITHSIRRCMCMGVYRDPVQSRSGQLIDRIAAPTRQKHARAGQFAQRCYVGRSSKKWRMAVSQCLLSKNGSDATESDFPLASMIANTGAHYAQLSAGRTICSRFLKISFLSMFYMPRSRLQPEGQRAQCTRSILAAQQNVGQILPPVGACCNLNHLAICQGDLKP